jgi:hypothetical protein
MHNERGTTELMRVFALLLHPHGRFTDFIGALTSASWGM